MAADAGLGKSLRPQPPVVMEHVRDGNVVHLLRPAAPAEGGEAEQPPRLGAPVRPRPADESGPMAAEGFIERHDGTPFSMRSSGRVSPSKSAGTALFAGSR